MPTPCEHCGEWFELNDGCGSEKWHKGIVICETCAQSEQEEIENDEEIEEQVERAENAMFDFNESVKYLKEKKALDKLTTEARSLIIHGVSNKIVVVCCDTCKDLNLPDKDTLCSKCFNNYSMWRAAD